MTNLIIKRILIRLSSTMASMSQTRILNSKWSDLAKKGKTLPNYCNQTFIMSNISIIIFKWLYYIFYMYQRKSSHVNPPYTHKNKKYTYFIITISNIFLLYLCDPFPLNFLRSQLGPFCLSHLNYTLKMILIVYELNQWNKLPLCGHIISNSYVHSSRGMKRRLT